MSSSTKHWVAILGLVLAAGALIFSLADKWSKERYELVEKQAKSWEEKYHSAQNQIQELDNKLSASKRALADSRNVITEVPVAKPGPMIEKPDCGEIEKQRDLAKAELTRLLALPAEEQIATAKKHREHWELLAMDPEIQRLYKPFLGKGLWGGGEGTLAEPQPVPYMVVKEAMWSDEYFAGVMCRDVHGADNDRGGWQALPGPQDLKAISALKKLHQDFKELVPIWIDKGLLPK